MKATFTQDKRGPGTAAKKTTATVTIVHDPGNPEGELSVTCKFKPDVKGDDVHVAGSLAMIAVKAIGEACESDD